MEGDPILPLKIYGPELSYFTGKLEAVIRFKELPYQRIAKAPMGEVARATGVAQVPGLQLADERWLTDTTPIIAWLDERYPESSVIPRDPVVAFFSRLLEDFADEWLWRPAMHYRWDFPEGASLQSRVLVDEVTRGVKLPGFVKRHLVRTRQRELFTKGDGVSPATWDHVEKIYLDTLTHLSGILKTRPYLLGTRPSLADFGFFGPAFRHFAQDPTSARIMRETAPAVYEWTARVWNARASVTKGELLDHVPDDWGPILDSIGSAYLPYLCANAEAWKKRQSHFDVDIESAPYRRIRTARYRVWCLEELHRHFDELAGPDQQQVRARLEVHRCWEPLWRTADPASRVDPERKAPFGGSHSMTGVDADDAGKQHWLPAAAVKRSKPKEMMMGNTALITGASSGIGAEFARLHAARGGDLVLVARREEALNALKAELEEKYGITATVIAADLSEPKSAESVFAATEDAGLQIDVLINNAGFGGHGKFHERDLARDQAMMQVNMGALVDLTHLYLAGMVRRGSGRILQVASTAGMMPGPLQAVYYATKAFVVSFSQAVAEELADTGVTSTALCPGAVDTGFVEAGELEGAALFQKPGASPESVAACGYEAMLRGDLVKINEPSLNFALGWVIPFLPRKAVLKLSRKSMEKKP
jgi:short-subunit dehydrogenase/glutathione S-transferase